MTSRLSIPVPRRMNALQHDRRGYPVPFIVLRDSAGTPHFTVNDHHRRWRCVKEKRCAICGTKLSGLLWFVGGPLSAFHPDGAYRDTALHHECMNYAMRVCPYLALRSYQGRIDDLTVDYDKLPNGVVLHDPTMIDERPGVFVVVAATGYQLLSGDPIHANVRPTRPYRAVEFWKDGNLLAADAAREPLAQALELSIENLEKVIRRVTCPAEALEAPPTI